MARGSLRVFLGIFCRAAQYEHRALMRVTMLGIAGPEVIDGFAPLAGLHVVHRFVVCGSGANTKLATAGEKDVMVLNVLNKGAGGMCGKHRGSIEFFQAVDRQWPGAFDWLLKSDYDAYVVLPNLLRALKPLPLVDGYFGIHGVSGHHASGVQNYRHYHVDDVASHRRLFFDDFSQPLPYWFMCGMLYGVTADVARWLRDEARAPRRRIGLVGEDFLLRTWLHDAKRGRNAHTCGWAHCHDLPYPSSASQNALPSDATARMHDPRNLTSVAAEKALFASNRELNRELADGREDARRGHDGVGTRIAAWRAYGHAFLAQTVVVHNIKSFAEYVAIAAYFERYKQPIARAATAALGARAPSSASPPWTQPLRTDAKAARADFFEYIGRPVPPE